jgi:hypothetical protein
MIAGSQAQSNADIRHAQDALDGSFVCEFKFVCVCLYYVHEYI